MAFNKHGQTGANIFIVIYFLAALMPVIRIFNNLGLIYVIVLTGLLIIGGWLNAKAIVRYGSSSAGEAFGIISGVLAWLASWGVAKTWRLTSGEDIFVDVAKVVALAVVSCLVSIAWRRFGSDFNPDTEEVNNL